MAKVPVKKRSKEVDDVDVIRDDQVYRRMRKRLERIMMNVDVQSYVTELYSLQTTRAVAALKPKAILQDSLRVIVDASVDEIATRSRATSIRMSALQALMHIDGIISDLSKYMLSKYASVLKAQGHTTITAQKAMIDVYLRAFLENKRALDYVLKMAEYLLEDVDAAGWSLKRVSDAIDSAKKDR